MHDLCDFAMFCLNFHTLLIIFGLTYSLSAPSCQFLFSAVFVFQVFRPLKVLQKFRRNYTKNQRHDSFLNNQSGAIGPPPGPQAPWWHGQGVGRAAYPPGFLVAPSVPPLAYI